MPDDVPVSRGRLHFGGQVRNIDDETVAGIAVVLVTWNDGEDESAELARTRSDQAGTFALVCEKRERGARLALGVIDDADRFLVIFELDEQATEEGDANVELRISGMPPRAPSVGRSRRLYQVTGTVYASGRTAIADARVVVWWQQMRGRRELAVGQTSPQGLYSIDYEIPQDAPRQVLLVIEALSEYLDNPLFSPPTPAAEALTIDVSVDAPDDSEWAALIRAIDPLLDGVTLDELIEDTTHQDLSYLAREVGKDIETLMRVTVSARLASTTSLPTPIFYAFLRQRVPATLPSPLSDSSDAFALIDPLIQNVASLIFGLSASTQTQVLTAAVALDVIGSQFTEQIPQLVEQLQNHHTSNLLNRPYLVGRTTLSELLQVGGIGPTEQQAFVFRPREEYEIDALVLADACERRRRAYDGTSVDDRAHALNRRVCKELSAASSATAQCLC